MLKQQNQIMKLEMLKTITDRLGQIPLLFTFRTAKEGGSRQISFEDYVKLLNLAAAAGLTDLVDVEVFFQKTSTPKLVKQLQDQGVKVVASNHHFEGTHSRTELVEILENLRESGADILKMAVMPKNFQDLLRLMEVTQEGREKYERPLITMSMGGTGLVSRLTGEVFGSALTFGSAGVASAPGQIGVQELKAALKLFHENGFSA